MSVLGVRSLQFDPQHALVKSSHDTALRDIQDLIEQGILKKDTGGGRSTSYSINEH